MGFLRVLPPCPKRLSTGLENCRQQNKGDYETYLGEKSLKFQECRGCETWLIPSTADASSPNVSLGNALILVHSSRYELGAPCPKFSGLQEVPAY